MKLFFHLLLIHGLCVTSSFAADAADSSILGMKIPVKEQTASIGDIANILRSKAPTDLENDFLPVGAVLDKRNQVTELTTQLKLGEFSVNDLLGVIKIKLGYDYEIRSNVIVISDPRLKQLGSNYELNALLKDMDLTNVTASEAVNAIAKKFNLSLFCITLRDESKEKRISVHLNHRNVREALDIIAHESGYPGWSSSITKPINDFDKPRILVIM